MVDALKTRGMLAITPLFDRRTHARCLSAIAEHSMYRRGLAGPHACLLRLADAFCSVIVDHQDVGGRRRRHQADVLCHRPRGPGSRLCHQRALP